MMSGNLNGLSLHVYNKPDIELASAAATVGYAAWVERHGESRTPEQIRQIFDPDNPQAILEKMIKAEKVGQFVGVLAVEESGRIVADAWGAEDISAVTQEELLAKRKAGKVYAWLAQLNVLPDLQGGGIGTMTLDTFLSEFNDQNIPPTVYVLDKENPEAARWYREIGYRRHIRDKHVAKSYFGGDAQPALQIRMQARSAADVRNHIIERHPAIPDLAARSILRIG